MAVKCYEEQFRKNGEQGLINCIKSISPDDIQIVAIKHDKSSKVHWHIVMKKTSRDSKMRVVSTLKKINIVFRDGIDDTLWENHGVESVGNFSAYVTYLLHQTPSAIADGKQSYDKTDIITNLSPEEVDSILSGYTVRRSKAKVKADDYIDMARSAGYKLEDINEFIASLNIVNMPVTVENQIVKAYQNGVKRRADECAKISRLFIYLKTSNKMNSDTMLHITEQALADKKISVIKANDELNIQPYTKAVITEAQITHVGDRAYYGAKEFTTDYVGYLKNKNKKVWGGDTLVVVADYKTCCQFYCVDKFFVCEVKDEKLICTKAPAVEMSDDAAATLKKKYIEFRDAFTNALQVYKKDKKKQVVLDVDGLNSFDN